MEHTQAVTEPMTTGAHASVMPAEVLSALQVVPEGVYVDATFGRGGHARQIASQLTTGTLVVIDKDPQAIACAEALKQQHQWPLHICQGSFKSLGMFMDAAGIEKANGILFDLGVSSPQLEDPARGFSFMREGPLDMRMDNTHGPTAAEWLQTATEAEIAHALKIYGQERFAHKIAHKIVATRTKEPILTTLALVDRIEDAIPFKERHKHFATRTFQAIRMVINQELQDIEIALQVAMHRLAKGGRLAVISFHSLEDRLVKQSFKAASEGLVPESIIPFRGRRPLGIVKLVGKYKPSEEEVRVNPRARSAILRVVEKC